MTSKLGFLKRSLWATFWKGRGLRSSAKKFLITQTFFFSFPHIWPVSEKFSKCQIFEGFLCIPGHRFNSVTETKTHILMRHWHKIKIEIDKKQKRILHCVGKPKWDQRNKKKHKVKTKIFGAFKAGNVWGPFLNLKGVKPSKMFWKMFGDFKAPKSFPKY